MLAASFIALIIVLTGIPVRFSIGIICLITCVNLGYMIDSTLALDNHTTWHLVIKSLFDWMVQLQVPVNIMFTQQQWNALNKCKLSVAIDNAEK